MLSKLLPRLTVATPCPADWNAMSGDDRVRFCGDCGRNVYNISALTRRQVYRLVEAHEGKPPCIRMFRRPDGTIVTRRCLADLHAAARSVWLRACAYAAMAVAFWTNVLLGREIGHPRPLVTSPPAPTSTATPASTPTLPRTRTRVPAGGYVMGGMPDGDRDVPSPEPTVPPRVSTAELVAALQPVREEARACATRYNARGVLHYEIVVRRDGSVRARSASGALARTECDRALRAAIAGVRFLPGHSRATITFSLSIRP